LCLQVYNAKGLLERSSRAYFEGEQIYWAYTRYDSLGRLVETETPGVDGIRAISTTDYNGLTTTLTNPAGQQKISTRNALGKVVSVVDAAYSPDQSQITYQYDALGNLRFTTDSNGNRVELRYDARGNKTFMDDPDMGQWSYAYNGFGELKSQTDAKGQTVTLTYDLLGRMKTRTEPEGTSTWVYDSAVNGVGKLAQVTGPDGFSKLYSYDALGRPQWVDTHADNQTLRLTNQYDQYSRLKAQIRPDGFRVEQIYDGNGFLTAVRAPRSQVGEYSATHLTALITSAVGDADALLSAATEFQTQVDSYFAKAAEYRTITDSLSSLSGYSGPTLPKGSYQVYRDAAGQRYIKRVDPSLVTGKWVLIAGEISFPIPLPGEYFIKLNSNGSGGWSLSSFSNSIALPNFSAGLTANGEVVSIGNFDGVGGNDLLLFNGSGQVGNLAIDGALYNQLIAAAGELEAAATFLASEADDYLQLADNLLVLAETSYRDALKLNLWVENYQGEYAADYSTLQANAANVAGNYVYFWQAKKRDAEGRLARYLSGNGLTTVQNYDPATGQLRHLQTGFANFALVRDLEYQYDQLNNLTRRVDLVQQVEETFGYDGMDRLTQSSVMSNLDGVGPWSQTVDYQYDALGNLIFKSGVGSLSYGGTLGVRPHAVSGAKGGTFGYDANGNLLSGNGRTLAWTSFNKPKTITKGSATVNFAYGADRARYLKVSGSNRTLYLGKLYEKVTHGSGSSATVEHKQMIYADGQMVAMHVAKKNSSGSLLSRKTRYMHSDPLGSVDTVTDAAGNVVERQGFTPFGARRAGNWRGDSSFNVNALFSNRGYTGHEHIDEVGVIHMNGRVYDPELGRFMSADPHIQAPHNTQSYNRYSYVLNNPMKYTDPSGYFFKKIKRLAKGFWGLHKSLFKEMERFHRRIINNKILGPIANIAACYFGGPAGCAAFAAYSTALNGGSLNEVVAAGMIAGVSAQMAIGIGDAAGSLGTFGTYVLRPFL